MSVVDWRTAETKTQAPRATAPGHGRAVSQRGPGHRHAPTAVSSRQVCAMTRQLATLLHAGMPLVPALSAMVEQLQTTARRLTAEPSQPALAMIVEQIRDDVNEGSSLADALGRFEQVFGDLYVQMVAAGEVGGNLEQVLARLAQTLQKRQQLTGKVKAAIAYPAIMTVVAVLVVLFLLSFVVPSITGIFAELERALPAPTRVLIAISSFCRTYGIALGIVALLGSVGLAGCAQTKRGQQVIDRIKLRLPLFGGLLLRVELARLTRTLGMLVAGGVPILKALQITQRATASSVVAEALGRVRDSVAKGHNLADAVRQTGLFGPVVFHVLATGQLSGEIEQGLLDTAQMYDDEVDLTVKTLTALLEPAVLAVMGVVVGFIVLAILLPIFEINQSI